MPDVAVFRAIFIVIAVMAGFAVLVSFWIHRFPPEEEFVQARPATRPRPGAEAIPPSTRPVGRSAT